MACQQPTTTTAATAAPPPIKITGGGAPPARPLSWANIALIGGVASCSAEALTYPLDWAKTRQQLHYNTGGKWLGLGEAVRQGVRQGGLRVVFSGMEAALLRQAIYGTLKITLYETFKARFGPGHTTKGSKAQPSMAVSVLSGAAAGGLSAAVASPTDLIKVRMQGEGMMQERRAYPSLPSAVTTIIRKEGLTGLYKGWIPTAQRDHDDDEVLESGDGGGGRCDTDQDCNKNGQCVPIGGQRGVCRCDERYAGAYCQHKRKNKLTAFLLSILLGGLAVDRFYLGYIGLGVVKLFLSVFGFVPACIANWSSTLMGWRRYTLVGDEYATIDSLDGSTGAYLCITAGNCLTCCIALGSVAWWLTDWILILKDVLHDADGHGLYDNM